jgi:hypothetical protein
MQMNVLGIFLAALAVGACSDAGTSVGVASSDTRAAAAIKVSFESPTITVGQSTRAMATLVDPTGATITPPSDLSWNSTDASIASVSTSGVVTALKVGTVMISASALGKSANAALNVGAAIALPVFQDNFDSGSRAAAQGGYRWTDFSSTVSVSSTKGFSGSHSLEFVFGPDALTAADDSDAEQRFQFGAYLPEVWIEYMLYVPSNYFHRAVLGVGDTFNNKFITFWRDDYASATDFRIRVELYPVGVGGVFPTSSPLVPSVGSSSLRPVSTTSTSAGGSFDIGGAQVSPPTPDRNFISPTGPVKVGDWTQIRVHVKAASALKTNDGMLEIWANGNIVYRKNNGDLIGPSGNRELHNGYLLGWANSGFTEKTVINVDDFKIYASNPGWTP